MNAGAPNLCGDGVELHIAVGGIDLSAELRFQVDPVGAVADHEVGCVRGSFDGNAVEFTRELPVRRQRSADPSEDAKIGLAKPVVTADGCLLNMIELPGA